MRVMGLDPGLQNLGWGVIEADGPRVRHVANGILHSSPRADLATRLLELFEGLTAVVSEQMPDEAAVEQTFVNRDGAGTLKLGQARAVALIVPARAGIPVGEYQPNAVKKAVVGVGLAAKQQVEHMVRLHLPGAAIAGPDAADALAVAICHAHHLQSGAHLRKAIERAEDLAAERRASAALDNLARTLRKAGR